MTDTWYFRTLLQDELDRLTAEDRSGNPVVEANVATARLLLDAAVLEDPAAIHRAREALRASTTDEERKAILRKEVARVVARAKEIAAEPRDRVHHGAYGPVRMRIR